jgi:hypothetical protein
LKDGIIIIMNVVVDAVAITVTNAVYRLLISFIIHTPSQSSIDASMSKRFHDEHWSFSLLVRLRLYFVCERDRDSTPFSSHPLLCSSLQIHAATPRTSNTMRHTARQTRNSSTVENSTVQYCLHLPSDNNSTP